MTNKQTVIFIVIERFPPFNLPFASRFESRSKHFHQAKNKAEREGEKRFVNLLATLGLKMTYVCFLPYECNPFFPKRLKPGVGQICVKKLQIGWVDVVVVGVRLGDPDMGLARVWKFKMSRKRHRGLSGLSRFHAGTPLTCSDGFDWTEIRKNEKGLDEHGKPI